MKEPVTGRTRVIEPKLLRKFRNMYNGFLSEVNEETGKANTQQDFLKLCRANEVTFNHNTVNNLMEGDIKNRHFSIATISQVKDLLNAQKVA